MKKKIIVLISAVVGWWILGSITSPLHVKLVKISIVEAVGLLWLSYLIVGFWIGWMLNHGAWLYGMLGGVINTIILGTTWFFDPFCRAEQRSYRLGINALIWICLWTGGAALGGYIRRQFTIKRRR